MTHIKCTKHTSTRRIPIGGTGNECSTWNRENFKFQSPQHPSFFLHVVHLTPQTAKMLGSWLGKTVTTTDKGVSFTWSLYEYDGHDFESQLGPPSNVGDHLDLAYLKDGRCYVRINPASNPDQPGAQLAWVLEEAGGRVHDNGLVLTITNTGVDQQNKTRPRWRSHRAFSNAKSRMKRKRRNDDDSKSKPLL